MVYFSLLCRSEVFMFFTWSWDLQVVKRVTQCMKLPKKLTGRTP